MNAIILAAGMGTRLRPLTNDKPKCMVEVCGVPMVERQIQFLREAGIMDITLVSGYKAEALEYLKKKYGVDIVFNDKYDTVNNIYSMYKVLDRFGDTYIVEGDVYMDKNVFDPFVVQSTYFARWCDNYVNEWGLIVNADNILNKVVAGDGTGFIMSGISFWRTEDAEKIGNHIKYIIANDNYINLFWDNAVIDVMETLAPIYVKRTYNIYEIDTERELRALEKILH